MLLLFLMNLGFAGGGVEVVKPATTAGGGRRLQGSRALAYEPVKKQKKWRKLDELKQEIADEAQELAKKEQISIDEARAKARQLLLLGNLVEKAKITESELINVLSNTSEINKIVAKKRELLDNEAALLAILIASTSEV